MKETGKMQNDRKNLSTSHFTSSSFAEQVHAHAKLHAASGSRTRLASHESACPQPCVARDCVRRSCAPGFTLEKARARELALTQVNYYVRVSESILIFA